MKAFPKQWILFLLLVLALQACALPGSGISEELAATQTAVQATALALEEQLSATPTEEPTEAPTARPSPTKAPTLAVSPTPRPSRTPAPLIPNCTRWDRLTREDVGKEMCVYGVISRLILGGSQSMIFEDKDNLQAQVEFRFLIINAWYPDIEEGDCVRGEGVLRENGPTSYLFINTSGMWSYNDPRACEY